MKYMILIVASLFLMGCQKEFEKQYVDNHEFSGEWYVMVYDDSGTALLSTYETISTYNTSSDADSIWVDDLEHIFEIKVKARVNSSNYTFATDGSTNEYDPTSVYSLSEGAIYFDGGITRSGSVADSIRFVLTDPSTGDVYELAGHRVSGFEEDMY